MPRRAFPLSLLALALAAMPSICQTAARPAPLGRLVDVGGYRVHLYCTGRGGPSVLIAGAGFSFDWSLVQPEVARLTTVCTYDASGTAWSDPGPVLTCRGRVNEIHKLVAAAHLETPLVLVGLSIGACVARLYAAEYPQEVSGMVLVDHAFSPDPDRDAGKSDPGLHANYDTPPVLIYQAPIVLSTEDISDFNRLPENIRQLHRWAESLHPQPATWETAEDCLAQLKTAAPGPFALGDVPLVVVSTDNQARGYARLQKELMALSRHSTQMLAEHSFHAVEIDQPELVIAAVRKVVETARGPAGR